MLPAINAVEPDGLIARPMSAPTIRQVQHTAAETGRLDPGALGSGFDPIGEGNNILVIGRAIFAALRG
jgi:hypothetical protein